MDRRRAQEPPPAASGPAVAEAQSLATRGRRTGPAELGLHFGRGVLMGTADMVPGVSGGTIALVVGVYERLVQSVRAATSAPLALLRRDRSGARAQARRVEWTLVVPLVLGILTAIAIGSGVVPGLLDDHPLATSALFFGLILGSLAVPWRLVDRRGGKEAALALAAAVVAFVLVGLPDRELADPALPLVFVAAAVAICAMVLPGISGAYLLLLIGIYRATLDAVHERDLVYVAVFGAGAITGLALFSRLLGRLLERHHSVTMAALLGLMVGSLRALWPWTDEERRLLAPAGAGEVLTAGLYAAAGLVVVAGLIALASRPRSRDE